MQCHICGSESAIICKSEIETTKITRRAHVDCDGHSQYRGVGFEEIEESESRIF